MTTDEAKELFGGSLRALADALGITEQAIYQWGDMVPELRVYQILVIVSQRDAL
jgi:hypothetical protein